jgi:hypothetical protein
MVAWRNMFQHFHRVRTREIFGLFVSCCGRLTTAVSMDNFTTETLVWSEVAAAGKRKKLFQLMNRSYRRVRVGACGAALTTFFPTVVYEISTLVLRRILKRTSYHRPRPNVYIQRSSKSESVYALPCCS